LRSENFSEFFTIEFLPIGPPFKTVQGQDQDRFGQDRDLKKMVLRPVLRPRPVLRITSLV